MLEGLKDFYFKELQPLPQSAEGTGIWPFTGNPRAWIDPTDPNYEPSIYADRPSIDVTGSGTIKSIISKLKSGSLSYNAFKKMTGINNDEAIKEIWEDFQAFSKNKSLPGTEMFEAWMSKHRAIQNMLKPDTGKFLKRKGLVGESAEKLYHGSSSIFKSSKDMPKGHRGYFATTSKKVAKKFGKNIHEVDLKTNKIFDGTNKKHQNAFIKEYTKKRPKSFYGSENKLRERLTRGDYGLFEDHYAKYTLEDLGFKGNYQTEQGEKVVRLFSRDSFNIKPSNINDELDALIKEADNLIK